MKNFMSSNTEQIKEKLDIVEVISGYIKVEKSGINYKARCPFHNEKTPSFFISSTRQSFYCFGCGVKGDIFSFVEQFEGLDFKGALTSLADKAGIKLTSFKNEDIGDNKDQLFEIMEVATKMYEKNLNHNKPAMSYLTKRGLSENSIKKWRIGFALDEWRNLHDHLLGQKFSKETMLEAGLIKKVPDESKYYDTFRDRIMFPISDTAGRVIAFSGRTLKNPSTSSGQVPPKYLNSPETKLFYKSEVLYGFNVAKNYIRKLDYAVLVEGQMDLIMSHQAGVLNTVASSGTALTDLHLKKIQKLSDRVVIAYDSDKAGESAAKRAAELAISLGMETKIASLKEGEDPASVVKNDPEEWKKALRESVHFLDFVIEKAFEKNEGRKLTKEILENVLPLVSLIKSDIEKSQFVKKVATRLRVPEESVWNDIKKIKNQDKSVEKNDPIKSLAIPNLEKIMIGFIFLEESQNKKNKILREKWEDIIGKEEIQKNIERFESEKEALIFEAERYNDNETAEKLLRRLEINTLKDRLQKTAITLDDPSISKKEEEATKKEFSKIEIKLQNLIKQT